MLLADLVGACLWAFSCGSVHCKMAGVPLPQAPDAFLEAETLFSQSVCSSTYSSSESHSCTWGNSLSALFSPSSGHRGVPQLGGKGRECDLPPVFFQVIEFSFAARPGSVSAGLIACCLMILVVFCTTSWELHYYCGIGILLITIAEPFLSKRKFSEA